MFFFIGGVQPRTVKLEERPRACPSCGTHNAYLKRVDHYLSLFFIPLFPVKKGQPFLECRQCRAALDPMNPGRNSNPGATVDHCRYCGRGLETDFSYCPGCGKKV